MLMAATTCGPRAFALEGNHSMLEVLAEGGAFVRRGRQTLTPETHACRELVS